MNTRFDGQILYAIRPCELQARFYRRIQTIGVFLSVLGGSSVLVSAAGNVPMWVSAAGAVFLAVAGAVLVSMRPGDKASINESDVRKYRALRSAVASMNEADADAALMRAQESDCPELEPLRDVAYNDVVREIGRPDAAVALGFKNRMMAALA